MYDIYAQPKTIHEGAIAIHKRTKRYHTDSKLKAFTFMNHLNSIEKEDVVWRVAVQIKNRIIFDLDSEDLNNAKLITNTYKRILKKELLLYKSSTGYHIYSDIYNDEWDWHYGCCKVLYPLLESELILKYLDAITRWYHAKIREEHSKLWTSEQFINDIKNNFPLSGLYCGIGDFDILFSIMVILKGYYCIRISKKHENDKIYKIEV